MVTSLHEFSPDHLRLSTNMVKSTAQAVRDSFWILFVQFLLLMFYGSLMDLIKTLLHHMKQYTAKRHYVENSI